MKNPGKPTENSLETSLVEARGGRPSRDEAERRRIMNAGVDHTLLDPHRILAAIAIDEEAPSSARVMAAKALLLAQAGLPQEPDHDPTGVPADALTRRTLALMKRGRPN